MPRKARELSPLEVRRLNKPGRWSVGGVDGLALQVSASGTKSWVLRLRVSGVQREMGLGGFPAVPLVAARELAREHRAHAGEGRDPIAERSSARSVAMAERRAQQTFAELAAHYIRQHSPGWRNPKHAAQWAATLRTYAEPVIGDLAVRDINPAHVIRILEPIWATKTETATRVRSRIELVLDFAAARGLREGPNPARWRGNLDAALPKAAKVAKVQHHAAVPVAHVGTVMARIRQQHGVAARALEFAILTAARSGEVRGATWSEIDQEQAIWVIPAGRMKGEREHRVPLSASSLQVLRQLRQAGRHELVFPGLRGPLSDMSLSAVLRRMHIDATVHGFRSTFRDWCSEHTEYPNEVAEMALAHAIGDKVEAAYRRGDLYLKRVSMMNDWGNFVSTARNLPDG